MAGRWRLLVPRLHQQRLCPHDGTDHSHVLVVFWCLVLQQTLGLNPRQR